MSFIRSKSQRPLRQVEADAAQRDAAAALARKPAVGAGCEADLGARLHLTPSLMLYPNIHASLRLCLQYLVCASLIYMPCAGLSAMP